MKFLYRYYIKEIFERFIAFFLLIFFMPVILAIAGIIRITSNGPAVYTQLRNGQHGKVFRIYKFRTMYIHLCDNGTQQATQKDVRVTPFGHFLRISHLDELPQLFNVIKGDMNLIGPRPHAVPMDHAYAAVNPQYWRRYHQKPGITGWAQINRLHGETKTSEDMMKRVVYDVTYAHIASPVIDCIIGYHTLCILLRIR